MHQTSSSRAPTTRVQAHDQTVSRAGAPLPGMGALFTLHHARRDFTLYDVWRPPRSEGGRGPPSPCPCSVCLGREARSDAGMRTISGRLHLGPVRGQRCRSIRLSLSKQNITVLFSTHTHGARHTHKHAHGDNVQSIALPPLFASDILEAKAAARSH